MKIVFNKDKYESDTIRKIGVEQFLLQKLNDNKEWVDILNGRDITDSVVVEMQNGERYFHVKWREEEHASFGAEFFCHVLEPWCDFVED